MGNGSGLLRKTTHGGRMKATEEWFLFFLTASLRSLISAMPQAIVDPEELRRFAATLKKFNTEVQDRLATLNGQTIALNRTWRDQEQKKFTDEFEQHMKVISHFIEVTKEYIPYLLRKAESIEQYLQQR